MSSERRVSVEIDEGVATITLNQPDSLNALSVELHDDLLATLKDLNAGDEVRVIRLRGAGRAFCAGADMTSIYDGFFNEVEQATGEPWELGESRVAIDREWLRDLAERHLWMFSYRKPIVAQVHGYCLGAGIELIGASDIVFAAKDARLGHPPMRAHGVPPTLGQWPYRIGILKTKELMFTGDMVTGEEAEQLGMVNHAVDAEVLDEVTLEYCKRVAKTPLDALTVAKHATNRWFENAGYRSSVISGADLDAIYHGAPAFDEFIRIAREEGIQAALAWRDQPYGTPHYTKPGTNRVTGTVL